MKNFSIKWEKNIKLEQVKFIIVRKQVNLKIQSYKHYNIMTSFSSHHNFILFLRKHNDVQTGPKNEKFIPQSLKS